MDSTTDFGTRIPELHLGVYPSLTILDATRADLTGGAMPGLTPNAVAASPGLIVATTDPVACDVTGLAILKYHLKERNLTNERIDNFTVWSQPQIVHATSIGVGIRSKDQYSIASQNVPELDDLINYINI